MANSINAVILSGNLTKDPELRYTQSQVAVCGMRIAVNGREKVGEQWRDRADFFDIRVWGRQAESCAQYLAKGRPLAVSGRLKLEEWEDEKGKHSRILIEARDVQFLGSRNGGGQQESAAFVPDTEFAVPEGDFSTGQTGDDFASPSPDDDIPF